MAPDNLKLHTENLNTLQKQHHNEVSLKHTRSNDKKTINLKSDRMLVKERNNTSTQLAFRFRFSWSHSCGNFYIKQHTFYREIHKSW